MLSFDEVDFGQGRVLILNKEPRCIQGNLQSLTEHIAEYYEELHSADTGDDTSQIFDAIKAVDFSQALALINEALSKVVYYEATNIELIP